MNKMDELKELLNANVVKVNELLNKKEAEEEKKKSKVLCVFAVIGVIAAIAAAAYGIYRFFAPDYLDDFEDDFFEEDDGDAEKKPAKQVSENAASEEDFAE